MEKKNNKKKIIKVVGIGAGLLALAGGVIYAVSRGASIDTDAVTETIEHTLGDAPVDATDFTEA